MRGDLKEEDGLAGVGGPMAVPALVRGLVGRLLAVVRGLPPDLKNG